MTSKFLRMAITIVSIFSLCVFVVGFVVGVKELLYPSKSNNVNLASAQDKSSFDGGLLLGLGDSLTRGIGDSSGQGYLGMVRTDLQSEYKKPVSLVNLAVSGQTSSQLLQQLKQPQFLNLIKQAKWITLTIGGNDLNKSAGGITTLDVKTANQSLKLYQDNLSEIFQIIRGQNPNAPVLMFALYNPYGDLPDATQTFSIVNQWNQSIQEIASSYKNIVVIPTSDLFQLNPKPYLYTDHFHPNQQGYERMAARMFQVIQETVK